jgi:hypothetical protein
MVFGANTSSHLILLVPQTNVAGLLYLYVQNAEVNDIGQVCL